MNRKRWVGVLVVCALLAGLAWWVRGSQSKETNDTVAIGVDAETAMEPLVLAEPVASAALPVPEIKPMPVAEKSGRLGAQGGYELDELWQAAEVDADFPLAEPGEGVELLQPIALQGDELGRAQIGDSVTLPLPDGSTLKARVTKVQLQRPLQPRRVQEDPRDPERPAGANQPAAQREQRADPPVQRDQPAL